MAGQDRTEEQPTALAMKCLAPVVAALAGGMPLLPAGLTASQSADALMQSEKSQRAHVKLARATVRMSPAGVASPGTRRVSQSLSSLVAVNQLDDSTPAGSLICAVSGPLAIATHNTHHAPWTMGPRRSPTALYAVMCQSMGSAVPCLRACGTRARSQVAATASTSPCAVVHVMPNDARPCKAARRARCAAEAVPLQDT